VDSWWFVWHHSIARPRKTPATCKNLGDITSTSRVIAYFVSNFIAMATGVGRGRICLTSFNIPTLKTPWWAQESWRYLLHKLSYSRFASNFVAMATGVGSWWNFSDIIALPRKPPATCMNLGDISRTSWVIAYFVSNFVAMATGVGRGRIYLTSFNSPTPKPPDRRKNLGDISYTSRAISDFVKNFVAMATWVIQGYI